MTLFGWKPKPGILYRSWHSPGLYIRGRSVNVRVSISINGDIYEGAFKAGHDATCEVWIFDGSYSGHTGSRGRVPRRIWDNAFKLSLPLSEVKITKHESEKFVSAQPDVGFLVSVDYVLEVKKPPRESERLLSNLRPRR